ncbi:DedA family protein/thiosulfate sulfurtransferase GlpE [Caballeronia sp. BR00000012568055]|uniref:DedA family protein/thiosulfate sulfurtransferase GlpE n=1 Tax=Caballeronia sp. BR00000012568055 TaxID=2918761 RepID=UPI0023FA4308|nr:DedA family protein/thiosulfate sulfurtransferase GlpE [Caballeronia sp. BR00000012568055]
MPLVPTALATSWGAWAVFVSVLATQLGVPVPAAPMLIIAGTLVAQGAASFWQMLLAAVLAVLIADSLWFAAGRLYGRRFLTSLVRFSLSIDSTLRTARNWFERFGVPLLALSKFVPGLGLVSAPMLGTTQIEVRIFVLWDVIGATAWASFWMLGGAALQHQIAEGIALVRENGATVVDVLVIAFVGFVLYRWIRRQQFRMWLEKYRITPDQLDAMMRSDAPPVIYDARPADVRRKEPYRIKGAVALDLDSPDLVDQILSEHEVVVYCVCPNEATAKLIARRLQAKGFKHVRPLKGGLDAWEKHGYPVEAIPLEPAHAAADHEEEGFITIRATAPE